jgi:hypothetical protein
MMTTNLAKVHCNQRITLMSANVTTNTVFEAFIEADKAMKELPAIREALFTTQNNLEGAEHHISALEEELAKWKSDHTELQTKLSAREAELAHATFRADAVEAKHRALRSILGGGDDTVVAVDGALSHGSSELDADAAKLSAMGQGPGLILSELDHPPSATPTPLRSSEFGTGLQEAVVPEPGQSETNPISPQTTDVKSTELENTANVANGPVHAETQSSHQPESPTSVLGASSSPSDDEGLNEPLTPAQRQFAQGSNPHLAFSGQDSQHKPNGMEWGYWIVNGGEAPYWYDADFIATLKDEYRQYAGHATIAA